MKIYREVANKYNLVSKIKTLKQFYNELDALYKDIEAKCLECNDPDCVGYIWLLKQEADQLYEQGVPLMEINNESVFIHSFPMMSTGEINVSVKYPLCSQICSDKRQCSIYKSRPLVCRLYPIGLETTKGGKIVWVLHSDCFYIRNLEMRSLLSDFEYRVLLIINQISPQLMTKIIKTYCAVDAISVFPNGENNYSILREVYHV